MVITVFGSDMSHQNDAQRLGLPDPFPGLRGLERPGMYYDRSGNEITHSEWAALWVYSEKNDSEYRRIAEDQIGPYWVSTVWLGMNHSWSGPPMIFETMVFSDDEDDEFQRRYSTELEAIDGHLETVEKFSALVEENKERSRKK